MNTRKQQTRTRAIFLWVIAILVLSALAFLAIVKYQANRKFESIINGLTETQESIDGKVGEVGQDVAAAVEKRKDLTPAEAEGISKEVTSLHEEIGLARTRVDSLGEDARKSLSKDRLDVVLDRMAGVRNYLDHVELAHELMRVALKVASEEPKPRSPEGFKDKILQAALKRSFGELDKALEELDQRDRSLKPEDEKEKGLKQAMDKILEALDKLDKESTKKP